MKLGEWFFRIEIFLIYVTDIKYIGTWNGLRYLYIIYV